MARVIVLGEQRDPYLVQNVGTGRSACAGWVARVQHFNSSPFPTNVSDSFHWLKYRKRQTGPRGELGRIFMTCRIFARFTHTMYIHIEAARMRDHAAWGKLFRPYQKVSGKKILKLRLDLISVTMTANAIVMSLSSLASLPLSLIAPAGPLTHSMHPSALYLFDKHSCHN